jgi:excisionase family DNA binding protein
MNDYSDVYLTPEQIAERLQVVVETVYRWLRSGKLRGSRISPKAWRVSERELASFMRRQNVSELLFEDYINEHSLGTLEHEPPHPGTLKLLDYRLHHEGQVLWFEVKEFDDDARLPFASGGYFDPYVSVRAKIGKATEKFRGYGEECCSLVLFNEKANLVEICTPRIVLGAMLGNVAFSIPVNLETGQTGPSRSIFTGGGKMIHPHVRKAQNTSISSIIALERFPVGQKEFQILLAQEEAANQRAFTWQEMFELIEAHRASYEKRVLRAIVYENPHAKKPLPSDIFTADFDERWGQEGGSLKQIYSGPELTKLRSRERQAGLDISPFVKAMNKCNDQL